MTKPVTLCFSDDMTALTDEIKAGNLITGYFVLTALRTPDGMPYYISNANYDSSPGELMGNIEIEKTQLSLRIFKDLQVSQNSRDIKLIPDPENKNKH